MLLFYCKETYNRYVVDNITGKVNAISQGGFETLKKYKHYIGGIDELALKDKKTIDEFKKYIGKGILKNVPLAGTHSFLLENYPEYFI